jgi:hypothetical protein
MGSNWAKAPSSRIIVGQPLTWAAATLFTTKFSPQTYQVRVISQINGWVAVLDSTATMFSTSTFAGASGGPGGTYIAANTANGDYFACNPGQILAFTSTTTTTGIMISVSEMA